ncbi:MAG: ABC-three component system protein, partial [Bacteroidota bacterium]
MSKNRNHEDEPSKRARRTSNVPGQALGYSLQFTRMVALLLEAGPGSLVSFEVFEDVGEDARDGTRTYVQTKSALRGNPLADRSIELWKTIGNWVDAIKDRSYDASKLRFVMYVSRDVPGGLADVFHAASSDKEAKEAIARAKKQLWGDEPKYPLRPALSPELMSQVERVFSAPLEAVVAVIQAFQIERGSGTPQADFAQLLNRLFVPRNRVETIANYAAGWVKREVDKLLEQKKQAVISWENFHEEMTKFIRKVVERDILQSFAPEPTPADKMKLFPRVFVQQLELIELGFAECLEAVSQFFKGSFDRTKWGESGEVHPSSLDELDERLMQAWKNRKRKAFIQASGKPEAEKGQLLYSECMLHNDKLEGSETPPHFIPGCY